MPDKFLPLSKSSPLRRTGKHASETCEKDRYALPLQRVDSPDSKPVSIDIRQELSRDNLQREGLFSNRDGREAPYLETRYLSPPIPHFPPLRFGLLFEIFNPCIFKRRAFRKKLTVTLHSILVVLTNLHSFAITVSMPSIFSKALPPPVCVQTRSYHAEIYSSQNTELYSRGYMP